MNYLPHLATRVFDTPVLMAPQKMEVILSAIGDRLGLDGTCATAPADEGGLERKPFEITPDGVAIIPIEGTLVHKSYGLDAFSGLRSYSDVQHEVETAAADAAVKGILLDIDSPGGEVAGSFDLADSIFLARSAKPIFAVANNDAFSGAYLLASSADRIYVSRTSGVGSIGVIVTHLDVSGSDEKNGYRYTIIHAGARKADFNSHTPLSEEARGVLEAEVERTYNLFVSTVARNRNLPDSAIRETEAGLFFGQDAIDRYIADKLGTRQSALADLRALTKPRTISIPSGRTSMDQETVRTEASEQTEMTKPVERPPATAPASTPAAMPLTTPAENAVDIDAIRVEARQQGYAEAREIVQLCVIAGMPGKATGLLTENATPAKARQILLEARADADPAEIHSQVMPDTGTKVQTSPEDSPVVKAVERMAKQGVK